MRPRCKNAWDLACNIVPMHTLDSFFEECPNRLFNEPRQTGLSTIMTYANIPRLYVSVLCMIHFLYSWPEMLHCTLSQTNFLTLPPSPVFENSPYRQLILINDAYSRWSTGNRGRATSASEVIEVAGSNHAIGVILNLAWGPNNFSPSMIWSWRTRSNSQTGLGAE